MCWLWEKFHYVSTGYFNGEEHRMMSRHERNFLFSNGWRQEGVMLRNPSYPGHFYTLSGALETEGYIQSPSRRNPSSAQEAQNR